jgi:tRNA threonylcarbamoyladenosine biosynthesis protein TsaE
MQFEVSLETINAFANDFWKYVKDAKVFAFHGEMGAGKTTIISALCRKKGVTDVIGSPTFSIINEYSFFESGQMKRIYHIDLYRLKDEEEVMQAGVEDVVYSGEIVMIEWPEKAPHLLDENTVHLRISLINENKRQVEISLPSSLSPSIK